MMMNELELVSVRLVKDRSFISNQSISNPQEAVGVLGDFLCDIDREVMMVVNLSNSGKPINCNIASIGALNETLAHPRELIKSSVLSNAASIILMHNHPSGSLNPSSEDIITTQRMIDVCTLIDIPLLDHIIVGNDNTKYYSFRANDIMVSKELNYTKNIKSFKFESSEKTSINNMISTFKKELKKLSDEEKVGYNSVGIAMEKMSDAALLKYYQDDVQGGQRSLTSYIKEQITYDEINKAKYRDR